MSWAISEIHAVCFVESLNSVAFLSTWSTTQGGWVPLMALGSEVSDSVLWANRLLYDSRLELASKLKAVLCGKKGYMTVDDLFEFYYESVKAAENRTITLGNPGQKFMHVYDMPASDMAAFKLTITPATRAIINASCAEFNSKEETFRHVLPRPAKEKAKDAAYMKAHGIVVDLKGKKAPTLLAKHPRAILGEKVEKDAGGAGGSGAGGSGAGGSSAKKRGRPGPSEDAKAAKVRWSVTRRLELLPTDSSISMAARRQRRPRRRPMRAWRASSCGTCAARSSRGARPPAGRS